MIIGYNLLGAINIDTGSTTYSASTHALVRNALTQALDRDLAADRLQEVLTGTTDTVAIDEKNKADRLAFRAPYLRTMAVVTLPLTDGALRDRARAWALEALDRHTKHLATQVVKDADTEVAQAVAGSLALEPLLRNVEAAVAPKRDPSIRRSASPGGPGM